MANTKGQPSAESTSSSFSSNATFEDISKAVVYPERANPDFPHYDSGNLTENLSRLRCEAKVAKVVTTNPLVKLMLSALNSKGCSVDVRDRIVCESCSEKTTGGYDPHANQIVVCHNRIKTEEKAAAVISHELIHMFDYCRAKFDFSSLEHFVCSEIRANNLVDEQCSLTNSLIIGTTAPWRIAGTHRECVREQALASLLKARIGYPVEKANRIVDKVFDRCYNDLEPIGRRIRRNSQHVKWAYRERFHYDYDSF